MGEETSSGKKCGIQGKKETEDYGKNCVTEKRQRRGLDLADLVGHRRAGYPKASISYNAHLQVVILDNDRSLS